MAAIAAMAASAPPAALTTRQQFPRTCKSAGAVTRPRWKLFIFQFYFNFLFGARACACAAANALKKKHKKTQIFATFFFDPTFFSAGNRQTANKITSTIPNDRNVDQKQFSRYFDQNWCRKSKMLDPQSTEWIRIYKENHDSVCFFLSMYSLYRIRSWLHKSRISNTRLVW